MRRGVFSSLKRGVNGLSNFEHERLPLKFVASHSFIDFKARIENFRVASGHVAVLQRLLEERLALAEGNNSEIVFKLCGDYH